MIRLTPVVKNLIIINVIMFVAQLFSPVVTGYLALWSVKSEYFQPYQLFTYMFLHDTGGFMHIFFNMIALAFMGPILETYWGPKKFTIFYMVTGIGAAVFSILMAAYLPFAHFDFMVGASGAVYGVLMGFGMMFPNMEVRLLIPPINIKAKYLVVVMFGISLILGGNVAHFAHLGGIIFAFIMITAWRKQGGGYY